MPTVVNGCGTWYWGKSNIQIYRGVCGACKRIVDLKSYDTRSFIVFLYLPIVPLGRKRILYQCSACRMHKIMKFSDWKKNREQIVAQSLEALQREPHNVQAAREALALAMEFQDEPAFDAAVSCAAASAAQDAKFNYLLGLGYERFSRLQEAEQAYRDSLAQENDPGVREALALNLLLQSKPDQAWELLDHVIGERRADSRGLPLLVAESYQSWGMHDAALSVLDDAVEAFPELGMDGDYKILRKTSEKHRHTNKVIKSVHLDPAKRLPKQHDKVSNLVARVVPLGIVVLLVTVYFGVAVSKGRSREVYVVNGLDRPYEVEVGTVHRRLKPQSHTLINIPEGSIDVRVRSDTLAIENQRCEIETDFLTRPFTNPVFVINPDHTALLLWEQVEYSQQPDSDAEGEFRIYSGELLTSLSDVDFLFREFPDEIDLPGGSPVTRTRVSLLPELPPRYAVELLDEQVGREAALHYVTRMALASPRAELYVDALVQLVGPQEYISVSQPLRAHRPVVVDAHRLYQEIMDRTAPEYDLVGEYRGLLESSPDDSGLQYLLGRVLDDRDQAQQLFESAAGAQPPCARAWAAMSYNHYVNGEFAEALPAVQRALQEVPESVAFQLMISDVLAATGEHAQALDWHRRAYGEDTLDYEAVEREISLLVQAGRVSEARQRAQAFAEAAAEINEQIEGKELKASLMGSISYVQGAFDEYVEASKEVSYAWSRFKSAVVAGDLPAAAVALADFDYDAYDTLLLSTLLRADNDDEQADQLLAKAVDKLNGQGSSSRKLATWLTAGATPDVQQVLALELVPQKKTVAMVALGVKYPQLTDPCLTMARRLNFDRRFPYHAIKQLAQGQVHKPK